MWHFGLNEHNHIYRGTQYISIAMTASVYGNTPAPLVHADSHYSAATCGYTRHKLQ